MAPHEGCLQDMAFGDHPAADARGTGAGLLRALCGGVPSGGRPGGGSARPGAETVAGTGLLQPRPQPARRGAAGDGLAQGARWEGLPRHLCRPHRAERRGTLHGSRHRQLRLGGTGGRGGRQRLSRAGAPLRHRHAHRHDAGTEALPRARRRTAGADRGRRQGEGIAGAPQPGDDGAGRPALHTHAAQVRDLPREEPLPGTGSRHRGRTSRETGEDARARTTLHIHHLYI